MVLLSSVWLLRQARVDLSMSGPNGLVHSSVMIGLAEAYLHLLAEFEERCIQQGHRKDEYDPSIVYLLHPEKRTPKSRNQEQRRTHPTGKFQACCAVQEPGRPDKLHREAGLERTIEEPVPAPNVSPCHREVRVPATKRDFSMSLRSTCAVDTATLIRIRSTFATPHVTSHSNRSCRGNPCRPYPSS